MSSNGLNDLGQATQIDLEKGTDNRSTDILESGVIEWDVDDPEKPLNWPQAKKWKNIMTIAVLTLLTYVPV